MDGLEDDDNIDTNAKKSTLDDFLAELGAIPQENSTETTESKMEDMIEHIDDMNVNLNLNENVNEATSSIGTPSDSAIDIAAARQQETQSQDGRNSAETTMNLLSPTLILSQELATISSPSTSSLLPSELLPPSVIPVQANVNDSQFSPINVEKENKINQTEQQKPQPSQVSPPYLKPPAIPQTLPPPLPQKAPSIPPNQSVNQPTEQTISQKTPEEHSTLVPPLPPYLPPPLPQQVKAPSEMKPPPYVPLSKPPIPKTMPAAPPSYFDLFPEEKAKIEKEMKETKETQMGSSDSLASSESRSHSPVRAAPLSSSPSPSSSIATEEMQASSVENGTNKSPTSGETSLAVGNKQKASPPSFSSDSSMKNKSLSPSSLPMPDEVLPSHSTLGEKETSIPPEAQVIPQENFISEQNNFLSTNKISIFAIKSILRHVVDCANHHTSASITNSKLSQKDKDKAAKDLKSDDKRIAEIMKRIQVFILF